MKFTLKLRFGNYFQWILLLLGGVGLAFHGHTAGTIHFANGLETRAVLYQGTWATAPKIVYGVFWATTNRQEPMKLALPVVTNFSTGVILGGSRYRLPGTEAGQRVLLQIRAWPASYGTNSPGWSEWSGQTHVAEVQLGDDAGPGTDIWQPVSSDRPDRFYPLLINAPLTPSTIVWVGGNSWWPTHTNLVDEGSQGTVDVAVKVSRGGWGPSLGSPPNLNQISRVLLTTEDGTALAGQDFSPTNILVTFAVGETQKFVTIKLTADSIPETLEQFQVRLIATPDFLEVINSPQVVEIREARVSSAKSFGEYGEVQFPTTTSQRYSLEFTTNLTSWEPVPGAGSLQGSGGVLTVTDPSAACCGPRFYRTRLIP